MFFRKDTIVQLIKDTVKPIIEKVNKSIIATDRRVVECNQDLTKMSELITKLQSEVDELNHLRDRKDSDEPWFEFVGGDVNPEHGLELRLDWNDAFIRQLRMQGYSGTSDDQLIAQYVANVQKLVDSGTDTE